MTDQGRPKTSAWRAGIHAHLGSGQVSRVVYGSIIGLALVLTLEAHPPSMATAAGTLLATGLAVGLAEMYSEVIGGRAREGTGGEAVPFPVVVSDTVAVTIGITFPSAFFIFAAAGAIGSDVAFTLAKWTGLGLIAGYGYLASRLSGSTRTRSFVHAGGVAVIAAALIAFKAVIH